MIAVQRTDISAFGTSSDSPRAVVSASRANATAKTEGTSEGTALNRAAKEFESVLLRQMLSSLERTTKVGDKGPNVAGQQAYGSMIVETVANAMAESGGFGLAKVLSNAVQQKVDSQQSRSSTGSSCGSKPPLEALSAQETEPAKFRAQGLLTHAVPNDEIRTSPAQMTGQVADRRFR